MISCTLWTGACEASTQVSYFAHERPTTADASIAAVSLRDHQPKGFYGYQSLVNHSEKDDALRDLTGVTAMVFLTLLNLLSKVRGERYLDLGMESKLLLFLVKMKHGLTFSALGVLFGIHRTSASRIFYTILDVLYVSTQGWIQWFSRDVVHASMPASFQSKYPNCRVIVDCSEVRIEKPSKVSDRVHCWSNYKSDFTLKFLIGITPSGYITFISDVYGGRASDTYIIANSRLVNLLEPGDMVMADKGFPHVKCDLESKDVTLVMPPFARANEQFTEAEMKETYKVASHRIHVERCIQRIKSFAILSHRLTPELKCHIDKILHVCSVLANLQGPVIKTL
uniref:Putative is4eu-1 dr n=1 Tax=Ixodes ricinus TaxID=34613 RepID=A0A147BBC9_IXORI